MNLRGPQAHPRQPKRADPTWWQSNVQTPGAGGPAGPTPTGHEIRCKIREIRWSQQEVLLHVSQEIREKAAHECAPQSLSWAVGVGDFGTRLGSSDCFNLRQSRGCLERRCGWSDGDS